ncbi:reverse transcriptase [Tanacetum coccineum]
MCAEVLSSMVRKSVTEGHIHGVKVCRGAPEISHMFFADDSIFFTRSSVEESCRLKSIFTRYCQASGQVINYEKSEISFSDNVDIHIRTRIIECLNVREVVHQYKYLGNLIDDIHKSLNVYWWGDGVKENLIWWCKWERMCILKFQGGLGFQHLGLFNRSLLAKQVWSLITSPTTLAARILKARYFPRSSFFDAKNCVNVWNDFLVDDHRSLGPKPNNSDVDQSMNDVLYWHNNPGGRFSCRYAYLLALEVDENMRDNQKYSTCPVQMFGSKRAEWEIFMMTLWGLWTRRNKRFHGQLNGREGNVEAIAKLFLSEHHIANQREIITSTTMLHNTHTGVWSRPEADHIKVNCDASWQKESGKAGLGFVARDNNGEVFSGARLDYYASSPLEAEAKAVHWAMSHALSRGYSRVTFETYSLCLVKALYNKVILLQIASLFLDILSHSMAFDVCSWSFVKRERNRVAHCIASLALTCSYEITLDGIVPNCANVWMIKDVLLSEME